MPLTDDPSDPRLTHYTGPEKPAPQAEVYLVLSEEERAKGFVRPLRRSYIHNQCLVGSAHFPVGEFNWAEDGKVVGS